MAHETIYFDEKTHIYKVNDASIPSVTSVLRRSGLTDYSKIPKDVLEYKRQIGTAVHRAIELLEQDDLGDFDPAIAAYIEAWICFKRENGFVSSLSEQSIYSAKYNYAGRLDWVGYLKEKDKVLIDIKTSARVDLQGVGPQTAAYENGLNEWMDLPKADCIKQRFAVKLNLDGTYKLIPCKDKMDFNIFLYALQIYNWRMKTHDKC